MFYTDTVGMNTRMFFKAVVLLGISTGLMACSSLQRSFQSGYTTYDDEASHSVTKEYYLQKTSALVQEVKEELGIFTNEPLTEEQKLAIHYRIVLKQHEDALTIPNERRQYFQLKPYFRTDMERIHFLRLPTLQQRKQWAANNNIEDSEDNYAAEHVDAIESNDIVPGMTKSAVKLSWGEPDNIDVAGDPLYNNERWSYKTSVPSSEGYSQETRVIFFESGRVAGWERY